MSTILKALRRLEREKSSLEARPLQDEVAAVGPALSRRRIPIVAMLAATAALGLGLGASLLWLWPRAGETPVVASAPRAPTPVVQRPVTPSAPVAPVAPAAPLVQAAQPVQPVPPEAPPTPANESPEPEAPVASAPPPAAFASPVAVVERPPSPSPPPAVEPAPEAPRQAPAIAAAESASPPAPGELPPFDSRTRELRKPLAAPPSPAVRPLEVARADVPEPAAAAVPRAGSEPPRVSALATPPTPAPPMHRKPPPEKVVRADLPDVFVSSTSWHPQKDKRSAKVTYAGGATKELHEGDAIGPLVVSVIEPSGVVFLHDGVELRRGVGAKN